MTETFDVVIVGGGIEGAAAAWALARRGVTDVLVVERSTVGSGMTGKSSGIVRCHYGVSSLAAMATVDDVRRIAMSLPRTTEHLIREEEKLRAKLKLPATLIARAQAPAKKTALSSKRTAR